MTALDDLLTFIFDGKRPTLYEGFEGWVRDSRRFRAFATTYQVKIRAKLRNVQSDSGLLDLRAELETAMLLLREERFTLAYEQYAASKHRGPDFTVTFKTHTPFNVEVRRIRRVELEDGDAEARTNKLVAVLCDKAGQMPPSVINVLWLVAEREISEGDLSTAIATLRLLAERKTEAFFTKRGYASAASFLKQYSHLSGIVVRPSSAPGSAGDPIFWLNPLARHKVPPDIVIAIQRL